MAVYTKTGDKGSTSLVSGERVSKTDSRVEAYGTVDELQANVALLADDVHSALKDTSLDAALETVLGELMTVETMLAAGSSHKLFKPISDKSVSRLEQQIDAWTAELPHITNFTIPGGNRVCSECHISRTVCRRAERRAVCAASQYDIPETAIIYLNRLSDWLYTLGRVLVTRLNVSEKLWTPEK